jgi:ankyrin repeat protein
VLSNILAVQGLLVDEPDEFLKTPLHYASECGAITSSLFLIQRGARVDNKNIFGNTPLGTCLQNSHWNLAIILLQNKCNMNQPVFLEDIAR